MLNIYVFKVLNEVRELAEKSTTECNKEPAHDFDTIQLVALIGCEIKTGRFTLDTKNGEPPYRSC